MNVKTYISELETAYLERVAVLLVVRLAWAFLAVVLLYVALDALFAFSPLARLTMDGLALLLLTLVVAWSARRAFHSRAYRRMLVRMMEAGNPALENSLTNALDFEERLDKEGAERFSEALMQQEIDTASERISGIQTYEALTPPTVKRECNLLVGLTVATIAATVLFFAVFSAVVPRFLLPFGDFPPYSAIHFAVNPGNTTVDFGDDLKIEVRTTHHIPETLRLVLLDVDGNETDAIDMHNGGEGQFFQTLENLREPLRYYATTKGGRTRRHTIGLNTIPRIEESVVTFTYPAYTNRDPETRLLSDNVLVGYENTMVNLRLRSNRPLGGGEIVVAGTSYPLQADAEANTVEANFPLTEPGTFHTEVHDVEGVVADSSPRGTIEITPDEKPEVVIAAPGMDSFAVVDTEVPILVDASDDLGIANVTIYRRHNESRDERKDLYEDAGRNSFVTVDETLNLKDLGLRPGDTIDYYVTATDSRPGAPQTASSEQFRLLIISYEEYREYAQSQMTAEDLREKYERVLDEMTALAEAQEALKQETDALREKLAAEGSLSESEQEQLAQAETEQAALAEEANAMAERLNEMAERPVVFDIEEAYKDALRDFAERLDEANAQMEQARQEMAEAANPTGEPSEAEAGSSGESSPSQSSSAALQRAAEAQQKALEELGQNVQEFQEGIQQANENLENVANVMADTEEFKYLYSLQKSLERSIRYYKDMETISPDDQVRLDELSAEQQTVMESLAALKERIRSHADELDALASKQKGNSDVFIQKK